MVRDERGWFPSPRLESSKGHQERVGTHGVEQLDMDRPRRHAFKDDPPTLLCAPSPLDKEGSEAVYSSGVEGPFPFALFA